MPIDFFKNCKRSESKNIRLGLCDDSKDGQTKPAYIDENDSSKWIAIVHNKKSFLLGFYAIDGCISWLRDDGTVSGKCDGMLCYDDNRNVLFVELKDRTMRNKEWRSDAKSQLKETISYFIEHHDISHLKKIEAFICNKRQLKEQRYAQFCNNFKLETGIHLYVSREIPID